MTENKFVEKTIARSGTMSRVYFVLHKHPEGLTIEQICEITGLKLSNVQIHGIKKLIDFEMVYGVKLQDSLDWIYQLGKLEVKGE